MNHTPGQWETSRDAVPDGHVQITVYAEDGTRVATVFDREANAPLIAAAPDLLYAVKMADEWFRDPNNRDADDTWHVLREAIYRAEEG